MIPIIKSHEFQSISSKGRCNELEEYYEYITHVKKRKNLVKIKDVQFIECWCKRNKIIIDNKTYLFKDIVIADYKTLEKIKEYITRKNITLCDKGKKAIASLYNRINRIEFIEKLCITVCPYCNRNFVNSTKNRTMCQFDHFFNKTDYPIFYVSFFNLIPVCSACNHIKRKMDFQYSPHNVDFSANDLISFSIKLKGSNMSKPENLYIILKSKNNIMDNNIKILDLEDLYQIHTDIVSELYIKAQSHNESVINMIYNNYGYLFRSKLEIKQLLIGTYIEEAEYHKRPLSKMINDISKLFGLL